MAYTLRFWWGAFVGKRDAYFLDASGQDRPVTACHRVPAGFAAAPVLLGLLCWPAGSSATS